MRRPDSKALTSEWLTPAFSASLTWVKPLSTRSSLTLRPSSVISPTHHSGISLLTRRPSGSATRDPRLATPAGASSIPRRWQPSWLGPSGSGAGSSSTYNGGHRETFQIPGNEIRQQRERSKPRRQSRLPSDHQSSSRPGCIYFSEISTLLIRMSWVGTEFSPLGPRVTGTAAILSKVSKPFASLTWPKMV